MFAKHDVTRAREPGITEEGAARWFYHMNRAISEERLKWTALHGEENALEIEKVIRWHLDHVLERMVWGGPTKQWTIMRVVFTITKTLTKQFMN
jgi:hypothetical protein